MNERLQRQLRLSISIKAARSGAALRISRYLSSTSLLGRPDAPADRCYTARRDPQDHKVVGRPRHGRPRVRWNCAESSNGQTLSVPLANGVVVELECSGRVASLATAMIENDARDD